MDDASTLRRSPVSDEPSGLDAVTQELQTRLGTFVERLNITALTLDHSRQCYQLIDQVNHIHQQVI